MKRPNTLTFVFLVLVSTSHLRAQNAANLPKFPSLRNYSEATSEHSFGGVVLDQTHAGQPVYPDSILIEYFHGQSQSFRRNELTIIHWRPDLKPSSISTKNFQNGNFSHISEYGLFYDAAGELKEYDYFTNIGGEAFKEKYEQYFDGFGELTSLKHYTLFAGQWHISDHFLLQYDRLNGKTKEIRYFDAYSNNLKNVRRYSDIIWNSSNQLLGFKMQAANSLQSNWDTTTTHYKNLNWNVGYASLLHLPKKISISDFTPRFPLFEQNYRPMPTSFNLFRYSPSDTNHIRNVSASMWEQNRLVSTWRMAMPTGVMDTVSQTIFERDSEGRLVYQQQNVSQRTAEGLIFKPQSAKTWQFDANGMITRLTQYHGNFTSHWTDSVVHIFTYSQNNSNMPQVWEVVDSLQINNQKEAYSRTTYYFSTVAATNRSIKTSQLTLYPNPGKGQFVLQGLAEEKPVSLRIVDALGRQVMHLQQQDFSTGELRLELDGLNAGMYLVLLAGKNGVGSQRLVVR